MLSGLWTIGYNDISPPLLSSPVKKSLCGKNQLHAEKPWPRFQVSEFCARIVCIREELSRVGELQTHVISGPGGGSPGL
jgi:hypothetical protein